MAKKINLEKHIYEGWCVKHFIKELQPCMDMVMRGQSWHKPFETREDVKQYTMDYQPYYKKPIADVIEYFCQRYGIK